MNEIDVHQVAKRYRRGTGRGRTLLTWAAWRSVPDRWALRDVTFAIAPGETIGLVGPNGSGKSTLLRVMAGLTRPTAGYVRSRRRVSALLTLGEGFHPWLSGRENAITGGILAGLSRNEAVRRLDRIAAFASLEDVMEEPLRTYSDGMRLRLAFAVAINIDPEILLIDEVLAVGDLRFQRRCRERLEELQAAGVTIVIASHDLGQIRDLCSRAVALSNGSVHSIGPAHEVADSYEALMNVMSGSDRPDQTAKRPPGTGDVKLRAVRVLDAIGAPVRRVEPGTGITIEVDFIARRRVPAAVFAVAAHVAGRADHCFDLTSDAGGCELGPLEGEGSIRLHLDRVDLAGGTYVIAVGAYPPDWSLTFDYLWHAAEFAVAAHGGPPGYRPPHRWSRL